MAAKTSRKPAAKPTPSKMTRAVVVLFVIGACTATGVLLWQNKMLPFLAAPTSPQNVVVDGGGSSSIVKPTSLSKKTDPEPEETPAQQINTFYDIKTEPIGTIPARWRVEQVEGLRAKTKVVRFSNGAEFKFVVPPYQLLPEQVEGGIYVIEPGREATGGGTTIPEAIDRYNSESIILRNTLATLDGTLEELAKLQKPQKP